ncbi:hypothetical protein [uncultured Akkermansia sp.]|jgi:protein-arginine kinase|uniref:hypothetical protein n=2 Tax=Akkermansia TaxID=239934 RepID=UPI0007977D23|nr:hypothetical protein [uncultured Akkermansia sp.]KXT54454.1 hypothetical protein HMPREF3038_00370 [Akkermansia sp. KLE1797]KXU55036.1 hypothetical protein HMPREF3039_00761 [Akkermansia sp. KLE1798]KZA04332.1 hypothetical protein HMPREF1326_02000 [Akkermansia sp. KLE1605]
MVGPFPPCAGKGFSMPAQPLFHVPALVCFKKDKILFPADSQSGFIVKLIVKHLFGECYKLKEAY